MTKGTGVNVTCGGLCLVLLLLLCLCVNSWAGCNTTSVNGSYNPQNGVCAHTIYNTSYRGTVTCHALGNSYCDPPDYQTLPSLTLIFTGSSGGFIASCGECRGVTRGIYCSGAILCTTQAEADSVACAQNPDLPTCRNPCSDYKDECESHGGNWQGSVTSDTTCASTCDLCSTPESQAMREYVYNSCCEGGLTPQYSCGFPGGPSSISGMVYSDVLSLGCNTSNWETQKICDAFYDESSSSQSSSSSSGGVSSSSVSEYCLLFPTDLACICAADSTNPDCSYLNSSGSPGSSGSGEGSSGSGGSGGIAGGDDWEYDYRDSLHRIINATTRTATNTQKIENNTNGIWNLLKNAKCLFTDCTDYDQLKTALDSSIVIPDGDTAGVIGSMRDMWDSSAMSEFLNAAAAGDINGIGPESLQTALLDFGNKTGQIISDTGAISDEMDKYKEMIEENFPTSQWSYTDACPGALSQNVSFDFPEPIGTINTGKNLGGYFCNPLPPFNVTLGNIIRAIIRLALTIAMAMGIFKAATGFNKDE